MLSTLQIAQLSRLETADVTEPDFINRYKQAVYFVLPAIERLCKGRRDFSVLEVGCGRGAKLCALSPAVSFYTGIEINPKETTIAREKAKCFGISNAQILNIEANQIDDVLAGSKFSLILLYAVLEHLTLDERHNLLIKLWPALDDDAYLYIGETPNLLAPIDYHSSNLPYFHMLPLEQKKRLYHLSSREYWKTRVSDQGDLALGFWRNGAHVSFYDFMLSLMPLDQLDRHIVYDNYDVSQLCMNPLRWHEVQLLKELAGHFNDRRIDVRWQIPRCFSRYWMDFILSKSPNCDYYGKFPAIVNLAHHPSPQNALDPFRNPILRLGQSIPEAKFINHETLTVRIIIGFLKKDSRGIMALQSNRDNQSIQIDLDLNAGHYDYWNPNMYVEVHFRLQKDDQFCVRVTRSSTVALTSILLFPN